MRTRHEIELPESVDFYTGDRVFSVSVDTAACGVFTAADGNQFALAPSQGALAAILAHCPTEHRVSLEKVSEAGLRFYRSGGVTTFSNAELVNMLFMTRYVFGHAFAVSATNSLEHRATTTLHHEALARQTELFSYGLACHFTSTLLGVPIDRFFFTTGADARPDFQARVTETELAQPGAGIGVLAPTGYILELEVKARTGWASARSTGTQGIALLKSLHGKVQSRPNRAFLGIIVALPERPGMPRAQGKIIIADPGEAVRLGEDEQSALLLEQAVSLLYQHGLWPTLARALSWLSDLRGLTERELELREFVQPYDDRAQYRIVERRHDGRLFNGRIFSDVVMRVGQIGRRGMSREEAEQRLELGQFGQLWYSGVDVDYVRIFETRDAEQLRRFGVRGEDPERDLGGRSAFYVVDEPMTLADAAAVQTDLRLALRHW